MTDPTESLWELRRPSSALRQAMGVSLIRTPCICVTLRFLGGAFFFALVISASNCSFCRALKAGSFTLLCTASRSVNLSKTSPRSSFLTSHPFMVFSSLTLCSSVPVAKVLRTPFASSPWLSQMVSAASVAVMYVFFMCFPSFADVHRQKWCGVAIWPDER
jgi:hypothetical protein